MEKTRRNALIVGVSFFVLFVLWTVLVCFVDVDTIGPKNSSVGFSTINDYFHRLTGVNFFLYTLTDWLGLIPILIACIFAIFGLIQLVNRKSISKVDYSIIALGIFYLVVISAYVFFEIVFINYRPTLIDGYLESSYPSSTTMLVMCVMPTTIMQLNRRIKNKTLKKIVIITITFFTTFMVIGRIISGVHWITDIIGGILFSTGVVLIYFATSKL